jgi:pentapeptide repeat protein
MTGGVLGPDEQYEDERFADMVFEEVAAGNCLFLECSFVGVSFGDCALRTCRFTDVTMREVRIVGTDLAETGWQDVTLTGCALAGVQAYSARWRRVVFRDGKLDSVNFRGGDRSQEVTVGPGLRKSPGRRERRRRCGLGNPGTARSSARRATAGPPRRAGPS